MKIHETVKLTIDDDIPEGSVFKGFDEYVVQDIKLETYNIRYRRARWQLPDRSYRVAPLPKEIDGQHFGPLTKSPDNVPSNFSITMGK